MLWNWWHLFLARGDAELLRPAVVLTAFWLLNASLPKESKLEHVINTAISLKAFLSSLMSICRCFTCREGSSLDETCGMSSLRMLISNSRALLRATPAVLTV